MSCAVNLMKQITWQREVVPIQLLPAHAIVWHHIHKL